MESHGIILIPFLLLFLLAAGDVLPAQTETVEDKWAGIEKTRWSDPNSSPMTYEEFLALHTTSGPFTIDEKQTLRPPSGAAAKTGLRHGGGTGLFLIIVNAGLEPLIQPKLDAYAASIAAEGYTVTLLTTSGGTPPDIRTTLTGYLPSGLIGAVLIGDLPVPWYEVSGAQFPCDFFYMDLDGTWTDQDHNGIYDLHQNNETPEIFVGRLTASPLQGIGQGSEHAKVNRYFGKIDKYRKGQFTVNARALAYPDDDWSYFGGCGLSQLYDDVVVVNDKATTTGEDYKLRLEENYEWIHVCVHSWHEGHSFNPTGIVTSMDIRTIDPIAHFYNLFACSNCLYTAQDYQGGWYIFADTYGLAAVGSTKSGSMLDFGSFYRPLGGHATIGGAFREWWTAQHPYSLSDQEWFYGMTLLGDPMLVPAETQLFSVFPTSVNASTGGTLFFGLDMNGKHYDSRDYQILVSASGTEPRTPVQGIFVPLVFDQITAYAFANTNNSMFKWFSGTLNVNGDGGAHLVLPPLGTSWVGRTLDFTMVIVNPVEYATRPLSVPIVP
jgi:hypothetical protein